MLQFEERPQLIDLSEKTSRLLLIRTGGERRVGEVGKIGRQKSFKVRLRSGHVGLPAGGNPLTPIGKQGFQRACFL